MVRCWFYLRDAVGVGVGLRRLGISVRWLGGGTPPGRRGQSATGGTAGLRLLGMDQFWVLPRLPHAALCCPACAWTRAPHPQHPPSPKTCWHPRPTKGGDSQELPGLAPRLGEPGGGRGRAAEGGTPKVVIASSAVRARPRIQRPGTSGRSALSAAHCFAPGVPLRGPLLQLKPGGAGLGLGFVAAVAGAAGGVARRWAAPATGWMPGRVP